MLVITHYQRLLDYIKPDRVHVLAAGRIVASGGPELALELEAEGYDKLREGRGMSLRLRPQDRRPVRSCRRAATRTGAGPTCAA